MDNDAKALLLLEEIAWRLHGGILEKPDYLRRIYASGQSSATEIHGGGVGPETRREGDEIRDDGGTIKGLRQHSQDRATAEKEEFEKTYGWLKNRSSKGGKNTNAIK